MYVVTLCEQCWQVSLADALRARAEVPACRNCGITRRVVPTCGYSALDASDFLELCNLVAEGTFSTTEATHLSFEIAHALETHAFEPFLQALSHRLPGIASTQLLMARNRPAQRRALLMCRSIFDALAMGRRALAGPQLGAAGATPEPVVAKS
jgi:hypothetical protein